MPRVRNTSVTTTHKRLFFLTAELASIQSSLRNYSARFGIVHGVMAKEPRLAQQYLVSLSRILERAVILGTESIPVFLYDLCIVNPKTSPFSSHASALQEILSRYQFHLLQQTDHTILREHLLQLCLEQAAESPITQSAIEYWKKEMPSQKIFLQKHIPSKWIPSPVVAQVSFRGQDLLESKNGFFLISRYSVQHFSFHDRRLRSVLSLPQHYAAANEIRAMKRFQNHCFVFCKQGIWLLDEHTTDLETEELHTMLVEHVEEWNNQIYVHTPNGVFVLQDDFSLLHLANSPAHDSYFNRWKLPILVRSDADKRRRFYLLHPATASFREIPFFGDFSTRIYHRQANEYIIENAFTLDANNHQQRCSLLLSRQQDWNLQPTADVSLPPHSDATPKDSTIDTHNLQITIRTENMGTVQIIHEDHQISLECTAQPIQKYLHQGHFLALLSTHDAVILDVRALKPLTLSPISQLSILYGSVQPFSELITITGSLAMDGRYVLYWSYTGAYGHRTNIAFTVYDLLEEEEIYCESAQDLDEVDEVVVFEKDFYCDEEIPYIAWVLGGHRSLIIDFEDVPDVASVSPYASSEWPWKPENLEVAPLWKDSSGYTIQSSTTTQCVFQQNKRIGSHLMPTETHEVCISQSGELIFRSSAKIFHVKEFSASAYEEHLSHWKV